MRQRRESNLGIETLIVVASAFLPICLLLGYLIYHSKTSAIIRAERDARLVAENVAMAIDREIHGIVTTLEGLSVFPQTAQGPTEEVYSTFVELSRMQHVHFVMRNLLGVTVMTTRAPFGQTYDTSALFGEVVAAAIRTGKPQVSNVFRGLISQARNIQIVMPTPRTQPFNQILAASLDDEYFRLILERIPRPEGRAVAIVDRTGKFVARHPGDPLYTEGAQTSLVNIDGTALSGTFRGIGVSGHRILAGFATSETSGWKVIVALPESNILGPLMSETIQLAALVGLVLLIALLMGWRSMRCFRRSTAKLLDAARAIRQSQDVSWKGEGIREFDEIGTALHDTFVAISLRDRHNTEIIAELSHRTKNLLAVIQAMSNQASRTCKDVERFQTDFSERLKGISLSHDLLVKADWKAVSIEDLVRAQLAPFVPNLSERIEIDGERVELTSGATQNLGMALHELATNAVKHGALKTTAGCIHVIWHVGNGTLSLTWRETNIQSGSSAPDEIGFGSLVLNRIAPSGLHGTASQSFEENSYEWRLEAPLSIVEETSARSDVLAEQSFFTHNSAEKVKQSLGIQNIQDKTQA